MRTVLICHLADAFDREGLAAWLASFSDLVGVVVLNETPQQKRARVRREVRRVGLLRFLDVIAMRLYQRLALAKADHQWTTRALDDMRSRYGVAPHVPQLIASDVNDASVVAFLKNAAPDVVLARCKQLLKKRLISIPRVGCFVLHPGICPEYRNAHGCFWALSQRDMDRVGMTLLKVDAGVDTGPVYGYYTYPFDEQRESHIVIQYRVVLENLDALALRFQDIFRGSAPVIDTRDRRSGSWGQPWFSRYVRWQRAATKAATR
ncbi:formyltransferase family protein [Dyella sp. 20L07]|uniref:formyltransferase family protein n=1 Tax=Dyella sp. 20L07 TaxID=3384240 RepID=UPI003D291A60